MPARHVCCVFRDGKGFAHSRSILMSTWGSFYKKPGTSAHHQAPRSQTLFGNVSSRNSVSRINHRRKPEFPASAFPNRSLGTRVEGGKQQSEIADWRMPLRKDLAIPRIDGNDFLPY